MEALKAIEKLEGQAKKEQSATKPSQLSNEARPAAGQAADKKPTAGAKDDGLDDFNRLMAELTDQLSRDREGLEVDVTEELVGETKPAPPKPKPEPQRAAAAAKPKEPVVEQAQQPAEEDQDERDEKIKEITERLLRVQAEFENYRKRMVREREEAKRFYNEELMRQLLPILDNFELAFAHAKDQQEKQALQDGVELILNQLKGMLGNFGLESLSSQGEMFDPSKHEAMVMIEDVEAEPGTVISEYQRGFLLHGRLLRPSQVVVARAPGATSAPSRINSKAEAKQTQPDETDQGEEDQSGSPEPSARVSNDIEKG
ncbi:MAG: nucleotide exchange factor GrpE [Candidatus Alcyoniella australis]|nr:nucleotide exchange factor GrpE [Candidatus Alcyoniella australis]